MTRRNARLGRIAARRGFAFVLLALAWIVWGSTAHADDAAVEAGFGVAEITPARAVPLGGYALPFLRRTREALDPLEARAMVLRSPEQSVAIVSLDLIGASRSMRETLTRRVEDLGFDLVVVAATHTHHGPGV